MGQIIHIGGGEVPDIPKRKPRADGRRALVLGGGGIAGAAFHIGSLLALNDVLEDFSANDFDLFVGTSAGAFVCACLANGITPEDLARSQLGRGPAHVPRMRYVEILRPLKGRLARAAAASVGAIKSTARQVARSKTQTSFVDTFFSMTEGLASWRLYTTRGIAEYLQRIFAVRGRTDRFEKLPKQLLVCATDLDTAERIVFGREDMPKARISSAVAASAAIPIIYEPVRLNGREYLDGGLRSPTNLDIALSEGATSVVLINPLVPYLHDVRYLLRGFNSPLRHVSDGGLGRLVAQVFRIMARAHLEKEIDLLRARYPDADILIIEPHRDDEHLFVFNLMDYSAREQLAKDAYEQVAVDLVAGFPAIKRLLARAGLAVSKRKLLERLRVVLAGSSAAALVEGYGDQEESA